MTYLTSMALWRRLAGIQLVGEAGVGIGSGGRRRGGGVGDGEGVGWRWCDGGGWQRHGGATLQSGKRLASGELREVVSLVQVAGLRQMRARVTHGPLRTALIMGR